MKITKGKLRGIIRESIQINEIFGINLNVGEPNENIFKHYKKGNVVALKQLPVYKQGQGFKSSGLDVNEVFVRMHKKGDSQIPFLKPGFMVSIKKKGQRSFQRLQQTTRMIISKDVETRMEDINIDEILSLSMPNMRYIDRTLYAITKKDELVRTDKSGDIVSAEREAFAGDIKKFIKGG